MKDVMDFKGDKAAGVRSFPRYIGERASNVISAIFFISAVVLSFIPFFIRGFELYFLNYTYLGLVFITDTMLLSTSFQLILKKKPQLKILRKFSLFAILIGLLAFLIGIFLPIK
jgi:4-hydroxybenzoate polyprenyltransferase